MNEKEANDWLYSKEKLRQREYKFSQCDLAEVYLEAIEKAKVLAEALVAIKNPCTCNPVGPCDCNYYLANEALAQWEKEK